MTGNDGHPIHYKRSILAALVIAAVVVHVPGCFAKPSWSIDWLLVIGFISCGLMTLFPFVLARLVPQSDFNRMMADAVTW